MTEQALYKRLGGDFASAAVVDHFSDQLLANPKIVNANPKLTEWHTEEYKVRLPGLKFLRALWVGALAGGPFETRATRPFSGQVDPRSLAPEPLPAAHRGTPGRAHQALPEGTR
jgi:hemoglobin